jgi:hypothetical protein
LIVSLFGKINIHLLGQDKWSPRRRFVKCYIARGSTVKTVPVFTDSKTLRKFSDRWSMLIFTGEFGIELRNISCNI